METNLTIKNATVTSKIISAYIVEITNGWSNYRITPNQVSNYMLLALQGERPELYIKPTRWLLSAWACTGLELQKEYCSLAIQMREDKVPPKHGCGGPESCVWCSNTGQCNGCVASVTAPMPDWRNFF